MTIFLDIDGTCADVKERYKKAGEEPASRGKRYTQWLKRVQNEKLLAEDSAIAGMAEFATKLQYQLVYLTGRSEIYRSVTWKWLISNGFPPAYLVMRPRGNRQGNGILKEKLIKRYMATTGEDPVMVIDDDFNGDIEAACHRNKWTFLKAKSGSYW